MRRISGLVAPSFRQSRSHSEEALRSELANERIARRDSPWHSMRARDSEGVEEMKTGAPRMMVIHSEALQRITTAAALVVGLVMLGACNPLNPPPPPGPDLLSFDCDCAESCIIGTPENSRSVG